MIVTEQELKEWERPKPEMPPPPTPEQIRQELGWDLEDAKKYNDERK